MSNRRKHEGEEDLQLQLLEVTQDPTYGKSVPSQDSWLLVRGKEESLNSDEEADLPATKVVH